jgi:tetratricopeptide (TPR) repeat protein
VDVDALRIKLYHFSFRYRELIEFSVPAIAFLWFLSLALKEALLPENGLSMQPLWYIKIIENLPSALLLLLLLAILIWLAFPTWFNLHFRYIAWWASLACGKLLLWLLTGWRLALLVISAVAVLLWMRSLAIGSPYTFASLLMPEFWLKALPRIMGSLGSISFASLLNPEFWLKVLLATALLAIADWARQARRRIVIMQFSNFTGDDKLKVYADGVSSLLLIELARLSNLFRIVEEGRPYEAAIAISPGKGVMSEPTLRAEDIGESLKGAVSSESVIDLGPVKVPVGMILALVGKTVEGPRLTGSVHKEGEDVVLVASISGGGLRGSWRVSTSSLSEPKQPVGSGPLDRMTGQMANRIFTDLEQKRIGTPRWRAFCYYTEGLTKYRDVLRTKRNKNLMLRQAERAFIRALSEDNKFLQCHYNLGVVYNAMAVHDSPQAHDSAQAAFSESVRQDTDLSKAYLANAYYAMAYNLLSKGRYEDIVRLCDQSIKLQLGEARAWDLKGFALRMAKESPNMQEREKNDLLKKEVIPLREIATALSWRQLCLAALRGKNLEKQKAIAANCTLNLAQVKSTAKFSHRQAIFQQAISLSPHKADSYLQLGIFFISERKWSEAERVLKDALQIEDRPTYWSYLAMAYAYEKKIVDDALKRAMISLPRTKAEIKQSIHES